MARKKKSQIWKLGLILVVLVMAWLQRQDTGVGESSDPKAGSSSQQVGSFEVLDGCSLVKHRHNDGDSFWVNTSKGNFEFRLYYADAPESAVKTYRNGQNNHKRLAQQGRALGGLNQKQTVEIGQQAKRFVTDTLHADKFRVATRWESVYGSPRKYAFVIVSAEGEEEYLHELLVSRGLARIHTKPMILPDETTVKNQKRRLSTLEQQAKKQRLGAWGIQ